MRRDAQATRRRLLDAAAAEFAARGIAGARVDRIAEAAESNKAQIYHYFASKDGLFDAVFHDLVMTTLRDVPIDPTDLPEYAGRLFDGYQARPHVQRLATWHRLERSGTADTIDIVAQSNTSKVEAIAKAQAEGLLPDRWTAVELLALVLHISGLWSGMTPEYAALVDDVDNTRRRRVVVEAVRALLT
ncbi:TetR family transcriptional regulator [Pseudonocardia sp. TRM90224]|uniref:TetR family transcriptional regulator n=1 Tax=Pseudonocardia sp. TRM90224 TaxID=2812678 RepID=UPI001E56D3F4|nr:TetR family transcriptional regulator [Pseudonocardia sp. TRM90224]